MRNVIVVCTGNICRSPMAAGLLASRLPESLCKTIQVFSAGTHALQGYPAQDHAIETMARIGIDISGHRARQLTPEMVRKAALILTMETAHLWYIRTLAEVPPEKLRLWLSFNPQTGMRQVADPYGGPLSAYQTCLETLSPAVAGIVDTLRSCEG